MIQKVYHIERNKCGFKGSQREIIKVVGTATDVIAKLQEQRKYDYYYAGDDYSQTRLMGVILWEYVAPKQRYHAREKWQWDDICYKEKQKRCYLTEEEIERLFLDFNVEDEDVLI